MTRRTEKRSDKLANEMAEGKLSAGIPMPVEEETPNPLPDNYHPQKQQSFVDDEEYDPESEDD